MREIVYVRGKKKNGKEFFGQTTKEKALAMLNGNAAIKIGKNTIKKLYCYDELRVDVLKRDNYICHYCGKYGETVDHIVPRSKGGLSTPDNLVCACYKCNNDKMSTDYVEYINKISKREVLI